MSFSGNKEKPNSEVTTLVRIRPRIQIKTWITADDTIFSASWDGGNVVGLLLGSATEYVDRAESYDACLSTPNSFYYHADTGGITLNCPDGFGFAVVEWDLRLASRGLNWHENPMDTNSGDARWEGGVVRSPSPSQGNPDLIFGYSPVQITSLQVQVADGSLMKYLHDWSLNGCQVKVWLCIGKLESQNISELFIGVGGSWSMTGGILNLQVQDPLKLLEAQWPESYFSGDDFSLAPNEAGLPIREVFGFMRSFLPVNVDYDPTPATNVNREWVVSKGSVADSAALDVLIDQGGLNDGFNTTVDDASYFATGDDILIDVAGTPKWASVFSADPDTGIIQHSDIGARTFSPGDSVRRSFVAQVLCRFTLADFPGAFFDQPLHFGRDWDHDDFAADTRGIRLVDNFEANIIADGFYGNPDFPPIFDPATMSIWVRTYGGKVLPKQLNGIDDMGERTRVGGTAGHPVVILWEILRNRLRTFREVVAMDNDAFDDMATDFDRTIGIAVPETKSGSFPTYKEVVQLLLQTELMRMHFRVDNGLSQLTITQTSRAGAGGKQVTDFELANPSYNWDCSELYSRLRLACNLGEMEQGFAEINPDTVYIWPDMAVEFSPLRAAKYLHRVDRTFDFRSLFAFVSDNEAGLIAMRLAKIIGERRGTISARLPISFVEETIDDNASVELERLPGHEVSGEINTRPYKLAQHQKSADGVSVILDDQKGIQDAGTRF